jgi:hypothetical protein
MGLQLVQRTVRNGQMVQHLRRAATTDRWAIAAMVAGTETAARRA